MFLEISQDLGVLESQYGKLFLPSQVLPSFTCAEKVPSTPIDHLINDFRVLQNPLPARCHYYISKQPQAEEMFLGSVSEEAETQDDRKKMKAPGKDGELVVVELAAVAAKFFGLFSEDAAETQDDRKKLKAPGKDGELAAVVPKFFGSVSEEAETQDDRKKMKAPENDGELAAVVAAGIGIGAGIVALAWGASKFFGSVLEEAEKQDDRKKMKAPGRDGELIYRDDFERNPRDHFLQLRNDKRSKK